MSEAKQESDVILSIDPGLNITGYAVVTNRSRQISIIEAGVLRTKARADLGVRLLELFEGLREVIAQHHPATMAIEELYSHYERPRTAILMGHARGALCLAAAEKSLSIHHYAATQIKRVLTGNGRATKTQMQLAVCREFALPEIPDPPDVADALAIAVCHVHLSNNEQLLT